MKIQFYFCIIFFPKESYNTTQPDVVSASLHLQVFLNMYLNGALKNPFCVSNVFPAGPGIYHEAFCLAGDLGVTKGWGGGVACTTEKC